MESFINKVLEKRPSHEKTLKLVDLLSKHLSKTYEEKDLLQCRLNAYDNEEKLENQDILDKMASLTFENQKTKSCLEKEESKNEERRKEVSTLEAKVAEGIRERETLHESWKSTLGKVIKNNNDKLKVG